jgi:hypothetical protein
LAYKIRWKSGTLTAEAYSSKTLAKKVLKRSRHKGRIIKTSLSNPPRSPLSGNKTVWVRDKPFLHGYKGFVYRTRSISALQKSELRFNGSCFLSWSL